MVGSGIFLVNEWKFIEFWIEDAKIPRSLMFRGRIDSARVTRIDSELTVKIQARALSGELIDRPLEGLFAGSLAETVRRICLPVPSTVEHKGGDVEIYANSSSTYGVLRLLAVTTGSVVRATREGGILFESFEAAIRRLRSKPMVNINTKNSTSFEAVVGEPIKRTT